MTTMRIKTKRIVRKSNCRANWEYRVRVVPFFDDDHREVATNKFMLSIHVDDFIVL